MEIILGAIGAILFLGLVAPILATLIIERESGETASTNSQKPTNSPPSV